MRGNSTAARRISGYSVHVKTSLPDVGNDVWYLMFGLLLLHAEVQRPNGLFFKHKAAHYLQH